MADRYRPPSDFLCAAIAGEIPFANSELAEENYRRLREMIHDPHPANRDWAALLISQQPRDTPELRAALLILAEDENRYVRAEAICGLALRDAELALPLVRRELGGEAACQTIFEAAGLIADASLLDLLREYVQPSGDKFLDGAVLDAIKAVETGEPIYNWFTDESV